MSYRLTTTQIATLAPLLSKGMTVGGWTMIAFAALAAILPVLWMSGVLSPAEDDHSGLIGFITFVLVLAGVGIWMIVYGRKRVHSVLEGELSEAEAEVASVSGYRYPMGFYVQFQITMPLGDTREGAQRYIGEPPWEVGNITTVLISADGKRFLPADQSVPADFGKVESGSASPLGSR